MAVKQDCERRLVAGARLEHELFIAELLWLGAPSAALISPIVPGGAVGVTQARSYYALKRDGAANPGALTKR